MTTRFRAALTMAAALLSLCAVSCSKGPSGVADAGDAAVNPDASAFGPDGAFLCSSATTQACIGQTHASCRSDGEFLAPVFDDCAARGLICVDVIWCAVCHPGELRCDGPNVQTCRPDGSGWDTTQMCDTTMGDGCYVGMCVNLCEQARTDRSYEGCEFFAADLDNAAIGAGEDASAQQYAVIVSNPGTARTTVRVEQNDAPQGMPPIPHMVDMQDILPGDLEVFLLPRREVDGASDHGLNDGTHTKLSSQAYRITSTLPVVAYQFNPLDNVSVFSNDASLLVPTSAIDSHYTVVAWPQTIANDPMRPNDNDFDFDHSRMDEDLRAFLTVLGTQATTHVHITLGSQVVRVVGLTTGTLFGPGDTVDVTLGPYDVLNLETQALNADFTGSIVDADLPVTVFVGSEASDAPRFGTYSTRQCCADHLEEQLLPDSVLGEDFIIARTPRRSVELNAAFVDPMTDHVAEPNEPEWVRIIATENGTVLTTSLPPPEDTIAISAGEDVMLRADQDFLLRATHPIAVLQAQASQQALGIDNKYPGGDPSIEVIPPREQYRQSYVLLTPDKYGFDSLTIVGPHDAVILLDGLPLPSTCTVSPADGIMRRPVDPPPDDVIYRCQLSYPDVIGLPIPRVQPGDQHDGVHTIVADKPVSVLVFGFDAFVSYGYFGGLNLQRIH